MIATKMVIGINKRSTVAADKKPERGN
jgi:hypothetical protein